MKSYILTADSFRMKVSQYLREYQGYSGRSLRNIEIYLDDIRIRNTTKLPKEGILKVKEKHKETSIEPIKIDLDIVYEDEEMLIVNKPPFLLTHPTLKKSNVTLANGIVYYMDMVPRFVSRLDMNTSGLIMVAKNGYTQSFMQSKDSEIKKKYLAIADGIIEEDEIVVEKNILKVEDELARIIHEDGQYAKTKFKVLKRYLSKDVSLVECELFTGRTHQIRVHLKSMGHGLVGDTLYNEECLYNKVVNRQLLHAYYISFIHPTKKEKIEIEIPMYHDMKEFLE